MFTKMPSFALAALFTLASVLFVFKFVFKRNSYRSKNLPKGSLGLPIIGETFSFLRAQKQNKGPDWIKERVNKYGEIFKTSLMGGRTVIIVGQAGNKFILGADEDVLASKQPKTLSTIAGRNNIFELTGTRYKLIKGAMVSFLKPESLQNYIKEMDDSVTNLLLAETKEKDIMKTTVVMKRLTFRIACNILFGIRNELTESFFEDFQIAFAAVWSLPINLPTMAYREGLKARSRIVDHLLPILRRRREEIASGISSPTSDILSCLLALRDENREAIGEEEILDNLITLCIASHDTSAVLLTLVVWKLSHDKNTFDHVYREQMSILETIKAGDGKLSWGEIQKMKYTWRVAQEMMRMIPPVFGSFRKALQDTSFGGYDIPKGWQVFWVSYGTHMDESIFQNPEEFDPSRFDQNNSTKPIPPYAYIPFGGGQRMCIGNEFARVEILTTIHKLVTMFEWSPIYHDEPITCQPMPYPAMGLPIKIKLVGS